MPCGHPVNRGAYPPPATGRGEKPRNCSIKKAPEMGAFLHGAIPGSLALTCCSKYAMVPMPHQHAIGKKARWAFLPRSRRDTSRREPECAARGQGGGRRLPRKVNTPSRPTSPESENNLVRFLLFIDFQHLRSLRHCSHASPRTAPPGAKRPKKAKKPTMPTRHGVPGGRIEEKPPESRAQALTRSRKPLFLSANAF